MAARLVFLVPGFFGFASVGAVSCFERVEQSLGRALRRQRVEARIVRCATQPTASIPRRADALRRQVVRRGGLAAREPHFIGHSTGGRTADWLPSGAAFTPEAFDATWAALAAAIAARCARD